ncbi:MAG: hypothetical protein HYY13_02835 [Nitrospirae bacterium]|nr:hypothetical protein [Nitrospirota bacterium]
MKPQTAALSLCLLLGSTGCAGILVNNLKSASAVAQRTADPMLLKYGAPGNILLFETLADRFADNGDLMMLLAQTYCSYAMGFVEEEDPERAILMYDRGRTFGLRSLWLYRPFRKAVIAAAGQKPKDLAGAVELSAQHLEKGVEAIKDKDVVDRLFWTGNCWGGWLNLNKRDPLALFDIPKVLSLMTKVVELDQTYFYGGGLIFFGVYNAGLPSIAGGGVDKSKDWFEKAFKVTDGKLLLAKVLYAEHLATLIKDEDLFVRTLTEVIETPPEAAPADLRLANEIAKLKAKRLLARKDEFF